MGSDLRRVPIDIAWCWGLARTHSTTINRDCLFSAFELPCTKDAPTCLSTCDKMLDCGQHQCIQRCHTGPCGTVRDRCDTELLKVDDKFASGFVNKKYNNQKQIWTGSMWSIHLSSRKVEMPISCICLCLQVNELVNYRSLVFLSKTMVGIHNNLVYCNWVIISKYIIYEKLTPNLQTQRKICTELSLFTCSVHCGVLNIWFKMDPSPTQPHLIFDWNIFIYTNPIIHFWM